MVKYPALNFPPCNLRTIRRDGKEYVWDSLRKRYLLLTPEEWVRRHVIGYLTGTRHFMPAMIVQEYPVLLNGQHQRADIVVVDNALHPMIVVECKEPNIEIGSEAESQAVRYNSVLKARFVMITNGLKTRLYETDDAVEYRLVENY